MKRKIIGLSTSTHVVSLPSNWLRKNGLHKGMDLEVEEKENIIVISKEHSRSTKRIEMDVSAMDEDLVWLTVDSAFINGYDEISLSTAGYKQTQLLTRVARYFPGLIIYEERQYHVTMRSISLKEQFEILGIISRIRNMTITIMDEGIDAMRRKNWEFAKEAKEKDYALNTYVALGLRYLSMYGYSPASKMATVGQYLKTLEMFSDRVCDIFAALGRSKMMQKESLLLLELLRDLYRKEADLNTKYTSKKLISFDAERLRLNSKIDALRPDHAFLLKDLVRYMFELEEMAAQLNT